MGHPRLLRNIRLSVLAPLLFMPILQKLALRVKVRPGRDHVPASVAILTPTSPVPLTVRLSFGADVPIPTKEVVEVPIPPVPLGTYNVWPVATREQNKDNAMRVCFIKRNLNVDFLKDFHSREGGTINDC